MFGFWLGLLEIGFGFCLDDWIFFWFFWIVGFFSFFGLFGLSEDGWIWLENRLKNSLACSKELDVFGFSGHLVFQAVCFSINFLIQNYTKTSRCTRAKPPFY
jgi:hypothetical protein